jgi:Xanthosine triphosphate pyrophosphatase
MINLVFITGNRHKIAETRAILKDAVTLETISIDLPEIQGTLLDITREKCRLAAEKVGNVPNKATSHATIFVVAQC